MAAPNQNSWESCLMETLVPGLALTISLPFLCLAIAWSVGFVWEKVFRHVQKKMPKLNKKEEIRSMVK
jgi:hypothetical protein